MDIVEIHSNEKDTEKKMFYDPTYYFVVDPDYLTDTSRKDRLMTPEAYVFAIRNLIVQLDKSLVANTLFRSIKFHGKSVRISPVQIWSSTDCDADALPGEAKDLTYNRSFVSKLPLFLRPIGAVVRFVPTMYTDGGGCHKKYTALSQNVARPEEVLLHELVHAFRMVSGKLNMENKTHLGLIKYDSPEEFYAILVTNMYQSEMKTYLRADHRGFSTLDKALEDSFEFFKVSQRAFELVDKFCKDNRGLTRALSKISVPFNPIAAYYKDPKKAQANSRSPAALSRDLQQTFMWSEALNE